MDPRTSLKPRKQLLSLPQRLIQPPFGPPPQRFGTPKSVGRAVDLAILQAAALQELLLVCQVNQQLPRPSSNRAPYSRRSSKALEDLSRMKTGGIRCRQVLILSHDDPALVRASDYDPFPQPHLSEA